MLEEISDERRLQGAQSAGPVGAIANLRSRRHFDSAFRAGLFRDSAQIAAAARLARHPVSLAYLAPFAPADIQTSSGELPPQIAALLQSHLTRVAPGSARHVALVEAIRRLHQRDAMAKDREDKERARAEGG